MKKKVLSLDFLPFYQPLLSGPYQNAVLDQERPHLRSGYCMHVKDNLFSDGLFETLHKKILPIQVFCGVD